ncbi:MAG: hypothetical protein ACF8PN_07970 [Phycisphaerales bacterium]
MATNTTRPSFLTRTSPRPVGQSAGAAISRANAHRMKLAGGGSTRTRTSESSLGDLGATIGGSIGGETGQTIGQIGGEILNEILQRRQRPTQGGGAGAGQSFAPTGAGPCPAGTFRVGSTCVSPGDALPGGEPMTFPTPGTTVANPGGSAVVGSFGLPARTPMVVSQLVRRCGKGMVLGDDDLCYPKAVLPRRSKFRKWRGERRPPVSAADMAAIRKAASARDRVLELAKDVGLHASKSRPRPRSKK